MKDYGVVRSTVKPKEKVIDDYSVWINTDIREVETKYGGQTSIEYEYRMVQYGKNEYIKLIDDKNTELETQLTDTQLALCEIYEGMM